VEKQYKTMNTTQARLKDQYNKEILPKMQEEFQIKNKMAVPRLLKIVLNIGAGDAKDNQGILDRIVADMTSLSGQKPIVTKAKTSISGFKLGKGQSIGAKVTLRGNRMYQFLDRLVTISLPKVRDFRGLPTEAFDNQGNYTLGLKEILIFPEVVLQTGGIGNRGRGLELTVVSTAENKVQGKRLLELMGVPFKKETN
jgi:large subunit ribosomal protein L5